MALQSSAHFQMGLEGVCNGTEPCDQLVGTGQEMLQVLHNLDPHGRQCLPWRDREQLR